jgi:hypothetical protein
MKIFSSLRRLFDRLRARSKPVDAKTPALPDPLDHPDIRRMNLHELADLPFNRACCADSR